MEPLAEDLTPSKRYRMFLVDKRDRRTPRYHDEGTIVVRSLVSHTDGFTTLTFTMPLSDTPRKQRGCALMGKNWVRTFRPLKRGQR